TCSVWRWGDAWQEVCDEGPHEDTRDDAPDTEAGPEADDVRAEDAADPQDAADPCELDRTDRRQVRGASAPPTLATHRGPVPHGAGPFSRLATMAVWGSVAQSPRARRG